jgi:hypothetical protein
VRLHSRTSVDPGGESEVNAASLPVLWPVSVAAVGLPASEPFPDMRQPVGRVRWQCMGREWSAPSPNNAAHADDGLPVKTLHLSQKRAQALRLLQPLAENRPLIRECDPTLGASSLQPLGGAKDDAAHPSDVPSILQTFCKDLGICDVGSSIFDQHAIIREFL